MVLKWNFPNPVVAAVVISAFLVAHVAVGSGCYNYLTDVDMLYFAGEVTSNSHNCSAVCNAYARVDVLYRENLLLSGLCFCRMSNASHLKTNHFSNGTCLLEACDSLSKPCNFDGFSYTKTESGMKIANIVTPDTVVVGNETEIKIEGLAGCEATIEYDFGDGFKRITTNHTAKHVYYTPGFFLCKVGIRKANAGTMVAERMFFVAANVSDIPSNIIFDVPAVIEANKEIKSFLSIGSGSHMKLEITAIYNAADKNSVSPITVKDTVFADITTLVVGTLVSNDSVSSEKIAKKFPPFWLGKGWGKARDNNDGKIVIAPSITFMECGSVTAFELYANKVGIMTLYVLNPLCDCCTCGGAESLTEEYTESAEQINDQLQFNVTKVIMINITEVGYQLHHLRTNEIHVKKGNMLAFEETSSSVRIKYGQSSTSNQGCYSSRLVNLAEGSTFGPVKKENKLPYLRAYVSKVFRYGLNQFTRKPAGKITYKVTEMNEGKDITQVTVPVQEKIKEVNIRNSGLRESVYISEDANNQIKVEVAGEVVS